MPAGAWQELRGWSALEPLTIAATDGIAAEEQGPAGGLVNTSFQSAPRSCWPS